MQLSKPATLLPTNFTEGNVNAITVCTEHVTPYLVSFG